MVETRGFIFDKISNNAAFEAIALEIFKFQARHNKVYKLYLEKLGISTGSVKKFIDIPFLPISFFKSHKVVSSTKQEEQVFMSSGTGGQRSKHFVTDLALYEQAFIKSFSTFYGAIPDYQIFALLPSYIEQGDSSLVYMVDKMITLSGAKTGGFYKGNFPQLNTDLKVAQKKGNKLLLLGVSYALLDFFQAFPQQLSNAIVMETGGMKGRKKEMIREELHTLLMSGAGVSKIHSEYGMTELLSQAYSQGNGLFHCPPQMQVFIRDTNDPFSQAKPGQSGGVNIVDFANLHSCSFIETADLGKKHTNGSFEILGRFDTSEVRGCNLLAI